jgi:competence CoiA-like predicted nuclease
MIFAIINNERKKAEKGLTGVCPLCKLEVMPICGGINIHHWRHKIENNCDYSNESEWHLKLKNIFDENEQEQYFERMNQIQIADVYTYNGLAIEFQNSTISFDEVEKRSNFYKKILWVLNLKDQYQNGQIQINEKYIIWTRPKKGFENQIQNCILDFGLNNIYKCYHSIKKNKFNEKTKYNEYYYLIEYEEIKKVNFKTWCYRYSDCII